VRPGTLRGVLESVDSEDPFSFITHMEPTPESRFRSQKRIASRAVFTLLWNAHIKLELPDMRHLYNFFRKSPFTASDAGWMFEFRMHQFLRQGKVIRLFPVGSHVEKANLLYDDYSASREGKDPKVLRLTGSDEYSLGEAAKLKIGRYYRSPATDSTTLDSLLLMRPPNEPWPILLMFKFIRNETEHCVNEDDLCRIDKLALPLNTRRYFVVVTLHDTLPQIVTPKAYFSPRGKRLRGPDEAFEMFHSPVSIDTLFPPPPSFGSFFL
jgi:hypothetical protein